MRCAKRRSLISVFYVKSFLNILSRLQIFVHQPMVYILAAMSNHISLNEFPSTLTHIIHRSHHAIEFDVFVVFVLKVIAFESRLILPKIKSYFHILVIAEKVGASTNQLCINSSCPCFLIWNRICGNCFCLCKYTKSTSAKNK